MKIIDYKILAANSATELEKKVSCFINQQCGWEPLGPPFIRDGPGFDTIFYQAITKKQNTVHITPLITVTGPR